MRACHLLSRISTFAHPVLTTLNALPTHPARTGLGACPCSGHLLLPQQVLAQRMRGFGVCRKEDMKTILTLHFCTSSVQAGEQRASWRRWHRAAGALPSFPHTTPPRCLLWAQHLPRLRSIVRHPLPVHQSATPQGPSQFILGPSLPWDPGPSRILAANVEWRKNE